MVFETSVTAYTGLNGDQEFRNVVLDMLPPAGKLLKSDWESGDTMVRENNWEYQTYVEDILDLGVAAFVQDLGNVLLFLPIASGGKAPGGGFLHPRVRLLGELLTMHAFAASRTSRQGFFPASR